MATSDSPLNVPNVTLAVARSSGGVVSGNLTDNGDGTITVTGAGFGNSGPEFAFNIDAANAATGTLDNSEIVVGPNTTVDPTSGGLNIVSNAKMVGGKGIAIGANGTALDSTSYNRLRMRHTGATKVFESRTAYFPESHSTKAYDYLDGTLPDPHPGGSGDNRSWQIKTVWNQADQDNSGADTNFFLTLFEVLASGQFRDDYRLNSNVPAINRGFSNDQGVTYRIQKSSYNGKKIPLDEPYTTEFRWDQGSLDSTTDGFVGIETYSPSVGTHFSFEKTGVELVVTSGDTRVIDSLTYPGYCRGYNIELGTNIIDQQVYRQVGPNAYARVAICNNADYFSATQRIFLPPTGPWSDTSITPELPKWASGLSDFSGMHVCVVGADNVQVGTGDLI